MKINGIKLKFISSQTHTKIQLPFHIHHKASSFLQLNIKLSSMEHFTKTFHFSSLFILLIFYLAGATAATSEDDHLVGVVPPVSLLCISECSTCPTICAPPPPPVPHPPPLAYIPLNSPPSPSPSPPRPTPSPPPSPPRPATASSHSPPPPAFKYYFSLPPPPPVLIPVPVPPAPTTAAPHGNGNAYNYYFYASKSSCLCIPAVFFWALFLPHLLILSSW